MSTPRPSALIAVALLHVAWARPAAAGPVAGKDGCPDEVETEGLTPGQRAEYEARFLSVGHDLDVVVQAHGVVVAETSRDVTQGKYRVPVAPDDFYRLVGRADLADDYARRRAARLGLSLGGLAATLAGGAWQASELGSCNDDRKPFQQVDCGLSAQPVALVILGVTALAIGMSIDPQPVDAPEMRRLADQHNQTLLRDVAAPRPKVTLVPYAAPAGAGIAVGGSF